MELLLTSGGITNPSIDAALVALLGQPIEESHAPSLGVLEPCRAGRPHPGVVDFSNFPHLDAFPGNTSVEAERWAAALGTPA